ncbi:MAG: hypothetical protein JXR63_05820 [Spirochaetales bacterium]|nr:hypothetical protein [Spirochaetales bacterium]
MRVKRFFCVLFLLVAFGGFSFEIAEMEFKNQEIKDILLILGQKANISIIPDDTVTGVASFYFSKMDIDLALELFLAANNLFMKKENNVYYVSRIKIDYDSDKDLVSIRAEDVYIRTLIDFVSRNATKTILYDALPNEKISIHINDITVKRVLEIVVDRYSSRYNLKAENDYFYIKLIPDSNSPSGGGKPALVTDIVQGQNGLFSIESKRIRLRDAIRTLFSMSEFEYMFLTSQDPNLEDLYFKDRTFEQMLYILMEASRCESLNVDGLYYITDLSNKSIETKYYTSVKILLTNLNVRELPNLMPSGMLSQKNYKIDQNSNSIILFGSIDEVAALQKIILDLDVCDEDLQYRRIDLNFIPVKQIKSYLQKEFSYIEPIIIENTNSFVFKASEESYKALSLYISVIDRSQPGVPITLKYIKSEDLVKQLPPSVQKEDVIVTKDPSIIFFTGSEAKLRAFQKDLEIIDRPVPQIRYDVLILQYDDTKKSNWGMSFDFEPLTEKVAENGYSFTGGLGNKGNMFDFNFDVVSILGHSFASSLQANIDDSSASVVADTTLNSLSGEKVSFNNTQTARYRDLEKDPDTGVTSRTGITREIKTGLMIDIEGWVSGNDMITMKISTNVSKQGAASGDNLPPTFERKVTTSVRTASGRPIIVSGLKQASYSSDSSKIPFLGDIPIIGIPFSRMSKDIYITEMVIYIVPHVEYPEYVEYDNEFKIEQIYRSLVK